jgi:hypothetical protein
MSFWQRLFGSPKPKRAPTRNFFNIQVGDVVSYDGVDYIVQQVLAYDDEEGWRWFDYQLVDGDREIWLGVEDDDGLSLCIYKEIPWEATQDPGKRVIAQGREFRLGESGSASVTITTSYQGARSLKVRYWDYQNDDDGEETYLSVERWGNETEASIGRPVKQYLVKIYPRPEEE